MAGELASVRKGSPVYDGSKGPGGVGEGTGEGVSQKTCVSLAERPVVLVAVVRMILGVCVLKNWLENAAPAAASLLLSSSHMLVSPVIVCSAPALYQRSVLKAALPIRPSDRSPSTAVTLCTNDCTSV